MQPSTHAATAYAQTTRSVGTPRSIEYQAFQKITAELTAANESGSAPQAASAVHMNTRLWLILAADLMGDDNQLPSPLRAQLLSLAEYSRKHGLRVLRGEGGARLEDLIELNTMIMRGLRGIAAPSAEPAAAQREE